MVYKLREEWVVYAFSPPERYHRTCPATLHTFDEASEGTVPPQWHSGSFNSPPWFRAVDISVRFNPHPSSSRVHEPLNTGQFRPIYVFELIYACGCSIDHLSWKYPEFNSVTVNEFGIILVIWGPVLSF